MTINLKKTFHITNELQNLENEADDDIAYFVTEYDEKLASAADDIKEMKSDSYKFSKLFRNQSEK